MSHLHLEACVAVVVIASASMAADATEPSHRSADHATHAPRTLDLKLAPLSKIFSPAQIDSVLSRATDPVLEHVEVEASRIGDLAYRDRSAGTVETIFDATVRTLSPSSLYAARVNYTPDVSAPYRPAPPMLALYHPSFPPPYSQR